MSAHDYSPKRVAFEGLLMTEAQLARQIVESRKSWLNARQDLVAAREHGNDEMEAEFLKDARGYERREQSGIALYETEFEEFDFQRWVDTEGW